MRIEHVALWTRNLERMKGFYQEYFGGKAGEKYINRNSGFESYFISFEDGARLEIMQMNGIPLSLNNVDRQFTGYIHIAFKAGTKEAVDELTKRLRIDGYRVVGEPRTTGDGYYESVILDPDGNRVEIVE